MSKVPCCDSRICYLRIVGFFCFSAAGWDSAELLAAGSGGLVIRLVNAMCRMLFLGIQIMASTDHPRLLGAVGVARPTATLRRRGPCHERVPLRNARLSPSDRLVPRRCTLYAANLHTDLYSVHNKYSAWRSAPPRAVRAARHQARQPLFKSPLQGLYNLGVVVCKVCHAARKRLGISKSLHGCAVCTDVCD